MKPVVAAAKGCKNLSQKSKKNAHSRAITAVRGFFTLVDVCHELLLPVLRGFCPDAFS